MPARRKIPKSNFTPGPPATPPHRLGRRLEAAAILNRTRTLRARRGPGSRRWCIRRRHRAGARPDTATGGAERASRGPARMRKRGRMRAAASHAEPTRNVPCQAVDPTPGATKNPRADIPRLRRRGAMESTGDHRCRVGIDEIDDEAHTQNCCRCRQRVGARRRDGLCRRTRRRRLPAVRQLLRGGSRRNPPYITY
jgi:hypothetical protein